MPDYLQQYFTLDNIIQIGISLAILLVFLILRKLFTRYFFNLLFNLTNLLKTEIFKQVVLAFDVYQMVFCCPWAVFSDPVFTVFR